jgi:hypothetical protein
LWLGLVLLLMLRGLGSRLEKRILE